MNFPDFNDSTVKNKVVKHLISHFYLLHYKHGSVVTEGAKGIAIHMAGALLLNGVPDNNKVPRDWQNVFVITGGAL